MVLCIVLEVQIKISNTCKIVFFRFGYYVWVTVAMNESLYMKNAGAQIELDFS